MGGIKFGIHPLFYAFGLYYAFTGRIFTFVIYTLTAVIHELGHSFAAASVGYRLDKITLMPFGAVAKGDIDGIKCLDELKIAFAGPFVNIAVGLLFVAFWWVYPQSYAFTDVAAEANLTLALINFLPVYPLDGGRIFSALLRLKLKTTTAEKICTVTGLILSAFTFGLFVSSIFYRINISLLFFSLFGFCGLLGKAKDNKYVRIYSTLNTEKLKHGVACKKQAVDKSVTVKKLVNLLDVNAVNEIAVFDNGEQIALLSQKRINEIIEKGDLYAPLYKYLAIKRYNNQ